MTANTRLTAEQKKDRKQYKKFFAEYNLEIGSCAPFTVAKVPEFTGSKMAQFSVSVCSEDESKFRRKVGEYYALNRLYWNGIGIVLLPASITAQDLAESLFISYRDSALTENLMDGYSW